jgi:hypothetical protein
MRLIIDELNKRCRTNACMDCGEVGHKLSECPKPKPRLLESVVVFAMPMSRIAISELPSIIDDKSCSINFNSDYRVDYIEHHLNDAFVLKRKVGLSPGSWP